ncbi:MAG: sigma-70 family RNA polymerase sigma factor [Akkermansiaceae bacterium]|nr:sigma-70 family RNA polymerase sigma factor [Akkermansiaceae bacterium]NNM31313.1 sigma-70 family RNA polymerase sigma factor [Akkermansiaceae bacterium]
MVRRAANRGGAEGTDATEAWAEICRSYWLPIYAFVRRSGSSRQDAEDTTQEFFTRILSKDLITRIDSKEGKLRSYLLGVLKNLLSEERKRAKSKKRGGEASFLPIDLGDAETRFGDSASAERTPDESYDYHWALMTLEATMGQVRGEYREKGKEALFEAVAPSLQGESLVAYAESAAALGMTESAVKVAAHRLRHRFRDALREQVARTLETGADAEQELRHLRNVLQQ